MKDKRDGYYWITFEGIPTVAEWIFLAAPLNYGSFQMCGDDSVYGEHEVGDFIMGPLNPPNVSIKVVTIHPPDLRCKRCGREYEPGSACVCSSLNRTPFPA